MSTRYDLTRSELGELLEGEPSYRLDQVWTGMYEQLKDPAELSNVPKALRAAIEDLLPPALRLIKESVSEGGQTVKFLWQLHDFHLIETVLMHYEDRTTVCISSQAGCAMACGFCATGQAGFDRHLTVGEIVEQVVRAAQQSRPRRIANVVFMGMGEPMANVKAVVGALDRLNDDMGIGARHLTVSTVGIIPGIREFTELGGQYGLAVSLHAANDTKRNELVPVNRRYPLADLARACHDHIRATGRRLSLEWAMIDGINDTETDVEELATYANALRAHVNLIPLNPTPGWPTVGSPAKQVSWFRDELSSRGVNATIRRNRGNDIDAACGQLRADQLITPAKVTIGPRRQAERR
ncbi:MAG: 23S rRNA (adenine(2503)-C(2))-methyltransferase RlmN [Actinobacteria bacterium]|nr:23S rRNA (adenine(2503)-C(2))-methyltransferase RlmN [Actinomycetota bacterium]